MSYAKQRLFLGICNVGTIVLLSLFFLANRLPDRCFLGQGLGMSTIIQLIAIQFCYVLVSAPFDIIGGLVLPTRHARGNFQINAVLPKWLRAVALQMVVFVSFGTSLILAETNYGLFGGLCLFLTYLVFLTVFQSTFLNFVATAFQTNEKTYRDAPLDTDSKPGQIRLHSSLDSGFSGGITGLPGFEKIIIPTGWIENLPKTVVKTEVLRRLAAISTGSRTRGVLIAFAWNLVGFFICHTLIGGPVNSVAKFADLVLIFTLWCFVGLLILPTISRAGVIEVDHYVLENNATMENLVVTMRSLDRLQEDEPSRNETIETIFHPIPCVDNRISCLASSKTAPIGAWYAARFSIYLSGCLSLLSRAVHCNCGLPERWILLPAD